MKTWEEQEEEDRRDRELRKRQRLIAVLIGLGVIAASCLIARFNGSAGLLGSMNLALMFPGLLLTPVLMPLVWVMQPLHIDVGDEFVLLVAIGDFIFYTGLSYSLMRLWVSRNE